MTGLMFPKIQRKKKRKKHPPSVIHKKDGTCYLCMILHENYTVYRTVHEHHAFPGNPLRQISEEHGFKVYLCPMHHEFDKAAVHENHEYMRLIQQDCQHEYEKTHSRQQFMALIGRNFLED